MRTIKRVGLAVLLVAAGVLPARAESFTIDSTNCTSSKGCYGLTWTLTINSGEFEYLGESYEYQAILTVADDPLVTGTQTQVISTVDFRVGTSVDSAVLYAFPVSSSGWTTDVSVLSSGGCDGPDNGFICSQTATDPANFTGTALTWAWYFNTSDPIFEDLIGAHVGAKMTDLSTPGRLLSATYVPEPSTFVLLASGLGAILIRRRKQ